MNLVSGSSNTLLNNDKGLVGGSGNYAINNNNTVCLCSIWSSKGVIIMSVERDLLATSHTTSERNLEYIQRKINAL